MPHDNYTDDAAAEPDREPPYRVGDKKPPRHSQFKSGQSGNPKGRPKGSVNLRTRVARNLREPVTVTINGRPVKMAKAEVIARQIVDTAAKGNLKAAMFAAQLDDEAAVAVSTSTAGEALALPNAQNLRFIMDRLSGLVGEGE